MGIDKDEKLLKSAANLRLRAEKQLKSKKTAPGTSQKDAETLRLLHELQVHQIELEMQNVELRQARDKMEVELGRYADLYDFAPTGYITLDCQGTVLSANLTAAVFLGNDRSRLIGKRFGLYFADQARQQFADFLKTVFTSRIKESCETLLTIDGKTTLFAQIDAIASEDGQACRVAIIDITKRKQAEETLLISDKIYRAIGESIDYGIWICDPDGRNIYASQSFLDLVGISQEQCSNFGWGDVLHPDDAEQTIAAWKECVRTGNTWDIEHRFCGVDGQWYDILARGLPVRNEHGDIVYWSGINLDISQLKKTEKALRQSEERHRVLAETMLQGVVHQDSAGRIITMNPAAERILGKSREEFVGNNSVTVEHDTIRENGEIFPGVEHPAMVALRTGLPVSGMVMGVFNPRMNELRWIGIDAVPVFRLGEDLPSEVYSVFEDITERKHSEIALQESEQRIQQALHVSRSFTFDWRPVTDKVIRSSSCAAILKLTDYEAVNDTGDNYFQSIHPDDRSRFGRILGDLTPACDSYTAEYRYMCKDGSVIALEETARAFFDSKGKMQRLVGVSTDITARKEAEQAFQRAHEELEQRVAERTADLASTINTLQREIRERETAEKSLRDEIAERLRIMNTLREKEQMLLQQSRLAAMGEMINNIAHQWRQPLNALGLLIQKLPIYYDSAEFNQEFLEENTVKSMKLIQHMSQTINDFRDFFRSDKEMVTFFLDTVVRQAVALIEQNFRDFGIKIELDNEQNLMVKGYPNEFAQALLNILMNAYDALVGNNAADARIILRVFKDGGSSVVTVTDNAGGIPGEVIDRVFDPYFTTKGPDKGTGLGLFMSKTIIEKNMAGRLTVRNTGNGAEFRIEVAYDVK